MVDVSELTWNDKIDPSLLSEDQLHTAPARYPLEELLIDIEDKFRGLARRVKFLEEQAETTFETLGVLMEVIASVPEVVEAFEERLLTLRGVEHLTASEVRYREAVVEILEVTKGKRKGYN